MYVCAIRFDTLAGAPFALILSQVLQHLHIPPSAAAVQVSASQGQLNALRSFSASRLPALAAAAHTSGVQNFLFHRESHFHRISLH